MSKLKNKTNMDEKLADIIREHYRWSVPTSVLNTGCFSNPQIRSHCCNQVERLEGDEECANCGHDTQKTCEYSCDISKACLAAFAFRLGVGGDKVHAAIKKNLGKSYEDLVLAISEVFMQTAPEVVDGETPEAKPACTEPCAAPCAEVAPPEAPPVESASPELPNDLLTIPEAAKFWGCTTPNIYSKISAKRLGTYIKEDRKYVSRAEVSALKAQRAVPKAKKTKKKGK